MISTASSWSRAIAVDASTARRYHSEVIRGWADEETEKLFRRQRSRKLPPDLQRVALRKLLMLDAATILEDLRVPPANRLEKLKGSREGHWSIRINDQWRVCFTWSDGNAYDVEIVDYH
jgi:toxin HigB-1